jgi:hypothetical protein
MPFSVSIRRPKPLHDTKVTIFVACMHAVTRHDAVKQEWGELAGQMMNQPDQIYLAHPLTSAGGRCSTELGPALDTFRTLGKEVPCIGLAHHHGCSAKAAGVRKRWERAAIDTRQVLDQHGFTDTRIFRFPLLETDWSIDRSQLDEVFVEPGGQVRYEPQQVPARPRVVINSQQLGRLAVASAAAAAFLLLRQSASGS